MPKKAVKMILDVVMTSLMVVLMNTATTGLTLHEVLGLFAGVLFVVHKALNWAWIRAVAKNLFRKGTKAKTRVLFALNVLVFLSVAVMIGSGVLISESLFHFTLNHGVRPWFVTLHRSAAYTSLVLISIHLGMHWNMIIQTVKKWMGLSGVKRARTIASRVVAVCIMLAGVKASADKNLTGEIAAPFIPSADTGEEQQNLRGYRGNHGGDTIEATTVSTQTASSQTLEEYLSGLTCTGCSRHCPLSDPQCVRGEQQAAQAETEYYNLQNSGSEESTQQEGSTQDSAESGETHAASTSDSSPFGFLEFIPIMGLFVGGTHYTVLLAGRKKRTPPVPRLPE